MRRHDNDDCGIDTHHRQQARPAQCQRMACADAGIDEATSNLDPVTAEHFAATINQLKGRATILFIAHALPKNLQIDEGVRLGTGTLGAVGAPHERISEAKPQERAAQLA